jgi:hypothetical protein
MQDIVRDRDDAASKFCTSKQAELLPLNEKLRDLQQEDQRRGALVSVLQGRVTEERVLGVTLTPEIVAPNGAGGKADWSQVIQNNVRRIGAILLTVFLVTILVPQYRYNIKDGQFL